MALDPFSRSDADLIALAQAGDGDALVLLVERHYDFIHRVAWKWCGQRTEAEDITQDVCARLARAIRGFQGQGALTTWLYALTLNAARDQMRRERRESRKAEAFGVHSAALGEAVPEADDRTDALWAAVRLLPDKQRMAILLIYGEERSHAEVADVMGCAEATVSWHVHEAKKRLKVLVRQAGEA